MKIFITGLYFAPTMTNAIGDLQNNGFEVYTHPEHAVYCDAVVAILPVTDGQHDFIMSLNKLTVGFAVNSWDKEDDRFVNIINSYEELIKAFTT